MSTVNLRSLLIIFCLRLSIIIALDFHGKVSPPNKYHILVYGGDDLKHSLINSVDSQLDGVFEVELEDLQLIKFDQLIFRIDLLDGTKIIKSVRRHLIKQRISQFSTYEFTFGAVTRVHLLGRVINGPSEKYTATIGSEPKINDLTESSESPSDGVFKVNLYASIPSVGKQYRLDYPVLSNSDYQFEYQFDFGNVQELVGIDIDVKDVLKKHTSTIEDTKMMRYRLIYFDYRGLAEPIRMLLNYKEIEYEDIRVTTKQWPLLKPTTPFGQLPVLEINEVQIAQSFAISRYLAKQFDLLGKDDLEIAHLDSIADFYRDFTMTIVKWLNVVTGKEYGSKEKLKREVFQPSAEKHLPILEKYLGDSGSGYLAKGGISWVDFYIASEIYTLKIYAEDIIQKYTELTSHCERIHTLPQLEKFLEKRKETPF